MIYDYIFVRNPEEKRPVEMPRLNCENNINIGCEKVDWICLVRHRIPVTGFGFQSLIIPRPVEKLSVSQEGCWSIMKLVCCMAIVNRILTALCANLALYMQNRPLYPLAICVAAGESCSSGWTSATQQIEVM